MIFDAIVTVFAAIVGGIGNLFGVFPTPDWLVNLGPMIADIAGWSAGMGQWVPVAAAVAVMPYVAGAIGVALTIRLVRIIVSLFTGGGGGAA